MGPPLHLRTLGTFELRDGTGRLIALPARRAETLFAYLALEGDEAHARRTLAALIWPHAESGAARASLRQALHAIRKALREHGEALVCDHHSIRLRPDAVDVDVVALERALRTGNLDGLRHARGKPLGELLPGAPTIGEAHDAWLAHRRSSAAETLKRGLSTLLEAEMDDGRFVCANATARALLTADPTCETGASGMIRSLVALERRADALRFCARFTTRFAEEVGASPSVDLPALARAADPKPHPNSAEDEGAAEVERPVRPAVLVLSRVDGNSDKSARRSVLDAAARLSQAHHGAIIERSPNTVIALFGSAGVRPSDVADALSAAAAIAATDGSATTACAVICANITKGDGAPRHWVAVADIARAERLADGAGAGAVRVDDAVARMAGAERFAFAPCGQNGALVPSAHRSSAARPVFVGRRAECDQLRAAARAVAQSAMARVVLVCGEPGAGKTRLLARAGEDRDGFRSVTVTCRTRDALGEGTLLAELHEALAAEAPTVGGLDRDRRRRLRRTGLSDALAAAAADAPLAITIENAENAAPGDLAELVDVIAATGSAALLWLVAVRREEAALEALSNLLRAGGEVPVLAMTLGPLCASEASELARQFPLQAQARADCVTRAAGNPLFLEQLLRHAGEEALVRPPPSILGALHGRLARLSPQTRRAIEVLALADRPFSQEAIAACLESDATGVEEELTQRALAARVDGGLTLRHALIGEAAIASMPQEDRLALHRRLARWYEGKDDALRAEHLAKARHDGAADAYLDASRAAHAALDFAAAASLARRGLALARKAASRHRLALAHGRALADLGDPDEAMEAFQAARSFATDRRARAQARVAIAAAYRLKDACEAGQNELDAAAAEIAADDHSLRSELELCRGRIAFSQGRAVESARAHERAIHHARATGLRAREAQALSGLTDAAYATGDMAEAFAVSKRCLDLCRSEGLAREEVAQLSVHVHIRIYLGEVDEALREGQESARAARRLGHWRAQINALLAVASAAFLRGDFALCQDAAQSVIEVAGRTSAMRFRLVALLYLTRVLLVAGNLEGARNLLHEAHELSERTSAANHGAQVVMLYACLADDLGEARRWIAKGTALLEAGAVAHNHLRFLPNAAWTLLRLGDGDGALRHVERLRTIAAPFLWTQIYAEMIAAHASGASIPTRLRHRAKVFHPIAHARIAADTADRVIA